MSVLQIYEFTKHMVYAFSILILKFLFTSNLKKVFANNEKKNETLS